MNRWGDEELEQPKENPAQIGFMINYQKIQQVLQGMSEMGLPVEKKVLLKIWANILLLIFILLCLTQGVFMVATVPFCIFYIVNLVQLGRTWKEMNYPKLQYIGMTIAGLLVVGVAALFGRELLAQVFASLGI